MVILHITWTIFQVAVGFNLVFPLLLAGIYFLARKFRKKGVPHIPATEADYAVIVTAYEQTAHLPQAVASLLRMNYSNFIIYVVADACDISTLNFNNNRVILLRPETTLASNTGSHFYAIDHFVRAHERLTIIDSDNLVHPEYLNGLNCIFDEGFLAVQGVRAAKNLDTMYACLDAARDKYYHFYDGSILSGAGSSATLAGSGMAFTTALYKECLQQLDIQGAGFDKVLQYEIVKRGYRIGVAEDAIVDDEKTSKPQQLVNQRARWIQSWFRYFKYGFNLIGKGMISGNWNQLLFGTVLVRPPLFIFLLLSCLFLVINLFLSPVVAVLWGIGLILFVAGFFLALAAAHTDKRIYHSLINIPQFMALQLVSLFRARRAEKYSIATQHNAVQP